MKLIYKRTMNEEATILELDGELTPFSGYYQIQKGEDILFLVKRFQIPRKILEKENEGLILSQGVTIFIPEITNQKYVVKPMDTVESVGNKLNISPSQLKNQMDGNFLYVGQIILY